MFVFLSFYFIPIKHENDRKDRWFCLGSMHKNIYIKIIRAWALIICIILDFFVLRIGIFDEILAKFFIVKTYEIILDKAVNQKYSSLIYENIFILHHDDI